MYYESYLDFKVGWYDGLLYKYTSHVAVQRERERSFRFPLFSTVITSPPCHATLTIHHGVLVVGASKKRVKLLSPFQG